MAERAIVRRRDTAEAEWRTESFTSLDAAINAYKDLVATAGAPGGCSCYEAELHVTAPGMQRAVYTPLPDRQENGIGGYAPVESVRLARINLSRGGAVLREAINPAKPYTESTRGIFARICARKKPEDWNQARVKVTWSRTPQGTCAGWSHPRDKDFVSADEALDALAEASARYEELGLRLLHAALSVDLYEIDEDAPNGLTLINHLLNSGGSTTLYQRATPDNFPLFGEEGTAEYRRSVALPAPPMLA